MFYNNKMNSKKHIVRTIIKSNRKIVERGEIDTLNTNMHNLSLLRLGTLYNHFNEKCRG